MTRGEALARLRAQIDAGRPIIGAGAGTGLSAKCAEAGGADLIIIYNSGRYRMAGRGSLAGAPPRTATPTRSSSTWRARCFPSCGETPVLAGVCGTDPFRLMDVFLDELKRIGLLGRAELPDRRALRRHVPAEPRGDGDGLRPRGRHDPARPRRGHAHRAVRLHGRRGGRDGGGGRRRARPAHGPDHRAARSAPRRRRRSTTACR